MGLEVSTYISGLTSSWPPSGDPKSQGDDHLRLIKGVLQATFPNATGPMYFPKGEVSTGPTSLVLDATDQNNVVFVVTTAGDVTVTLPAGFDTTKAGWSCEIVKATGDTNAAVVSAASGTITSRAGGTTTIRVGAYCEPARFIWTGSGWICSKPGPVIGSTINWDAVTAPSGYLTLDGSVFNGTTYAELASVLGTTTLRDKRGRVEIGSGTGSGLTARVLGTAYGAETQALALTNLPNHVHTGTTGVDSPDHTHSYATGASNGITYAPNPGAFSGSLGVGTLTGGASARHAHGFSTDTLSGANGTAFGLLQPSIGTQKLIRAC